MPDLEYALNIYPDEINCYKKIYSVIAKMLSNSLHQKKLIA